MALLQLVQWGLKNTASERFSEEEQVTISLSAEKIMWEKQGKEIIIDGKFFDLKSFIIEDGLMVATGHFDHYETELAAFLLNLTSQQNQSRLLNLVFILQCFAAVSMLSLAPPVRSFLKTIVGYTTQALTPLLSPVLGQPPEVKTGSQG